MDAFSPTATDALSKTTAGNDTIKGVSAILSTDGTLNAGDNIDGGAGNDTLKIDMQSDFSGFTAGVGGLKNVETVNLSNTDDIARTFNAAGVTGATEYVLNGNISLGDLVNTAAAVTLNGAQSDVTIGYATAAKVDTGKADAQTINLNGVGTVGVDATATTDAVNEVVVGITAANIETLTLTTKGVNVVDLAGSAGAKAIMVAGSGTLNTTVAAATKTFDASANTGAVKVDLDNATANAITTVATGAGDDIITANVADLAINATIAGGAGADRLELSGAETVQYQMSGVETIALGSVGAGLIFSAAKTSGVTTIEATADMVAAETATFASMGAGALTFNLMGAGAAAVITADQTGASSVNVVASKEADKDNVDSNAVGVTLTNSTTLKLNVGEFAKYTGAINAAKATSVVSTGTLTGAVLTLGAATTGVFTTTATSSVVLAASKMTNLNVTSGKDFTITTAGSVKWTPYLRQSFK